MSVLTVKTSEMEAVPTKPFKREIVWSNVTVFVIGHLLGFYGLYIALFHAPLIRFITMLVVGYYFAIQGVLMGAHRYYSHRCFKASKAMQVAMIINHTASSQNSMWVWVRDHRQHHKYTDTDADPHNAKNGFFFSHVGWLLSKKHPDIIEKGKGIDMSDLNADPLVMFQKRHYFKLWIVFAVVIPCLIPVVIWGETLWNSFLVWVVLRTLLTLNFTWLVNSWAHFYGTKPFDKNMLPVESYFVSVLAMGEGWHNYHHAFPWDYKASEFGTPLTVTTSFIRFWARLGFVWDLKEASSDMVIARARRTGDGTPIRTKAKDHHGLPED